MRTPTPRHLIVALLLAASALATPGPAAAREPEGHRHEIGPAPPIPAVEAPARARPGGRYETTIPALPASVDECELFLLPDDGSGRMIQLTPEGEADEGPLRWTMPAVRATRARLVLRAGGRFREGESPPSAWFPVEAAPAPDRAEVLRGEHELAWHFGRDEAPGPAAFVPPGSAALGIARVTVLAAVAPETPAAELPARSRDGSSSAAVRMEPDPSAPHPSRRPAFVPLRN